MEIEVSHADSRLEMTIQWMYRISNINTQFLTHHVNCEVFLSNAAGSLHKHFDDDRTPALEAIANPEMRVTQFAEIPTQAPRTYYAPRVCLETDHSY